MAYVRVPAHDGRPPRTLAGHLISHVFKGALPDGRFPHPYRRHRANPVHRVQRRREVPAVLFRRPRRRNAHGRRTHDRRTGQQLDHHQHRRRTDRRQTHRHPRGADRPGPGQRLPQHPRRRHRRRPRGLERPRRAVPHPADRPRTRDPLLPARPRRPPDRGRSVQSLTGSSNQPLPRGDAPCSSPTRPCRVIENLLRNDLLLVDEVGSTPSMTPAPSHCSGSYQQPTNAALWAWPATGRSTSVPLELVTTTRVTPAWPIRCARTAASSLGRAVDTPYRITVPTSVSAEAASRWSRQAAPMTTSAWLRIRTGPKPRASSRRNAPAPGVRSPVA